ncbi:TPA: trypsin-like peptidase domain-containing protein [Candidatus Woesearchaeota archaeon]|nr:hypothetical protein [archaeon]HIJ11901.1 trypsin-like peptidase domain-containing protein [Candidatus Woesearchaeota archaeon]
MGLEKLLRNVTLAVGLLFPGSLYELKDRFLANSSVNVNAEFRNSLVELESTNTTQIPNGKSFSITYFSNGVFITPNTVLTVAHVLAPTTDESLNFDVYDAQKVGRVHLRHEISITFACDSSKHPAELAKADHIKDIAYLTVQNPPPCAQGFHLDSAKYPRYEGESILLGTVSQGDVSYHPATLLHHAHDLYHVRLDDSPLVPGMSGSPFFAVEDGAYHLLGLFHKGGFRDVNFGVVVDPRRSQTQSIYRLQGRVIMQPGSVIMR